MSILNLLRNVTAKYDRPPHPCLYEKKRSVRVSYLTGLAMQAHADAYLDPQERETFLQIAEAFELPEQEALAILAEAADPTEETVAQIREDLMNATLKYYFILDLQIMAHQDSQVSRVESDVLDQFGKLLDIAPEDIRFMVELADAVVEEDPEAKRRWTEKFFTSMTGARGAGPEAFSHYTSGDDPN